MKRMIPVILALLLIPRAACAQKVSIAALREQTEEMGRWTQTYSTPNGTLEVDVPIIVPDADTCPVLTLQKALPETAVPGGQTGGAQEPLLEAEIDGTLWAFQGLNMNGSGLAGRSEAVGGILIRCGSYLTGEAAYATPVTRHYPWEIDPDQPLARGSEQTLAEAMALWQAQIELCYPGEEITIAPKRIYVHGSALAQGTGEGKYDGEHGYYRILAEQLIGGFPVFGAIASPLGSNHFYIPYMSSVEEDAKRLIPYRVGSFWSCGNRLEMVSADGANNQTWSSLDRVRTVEYEDVPLASLDEVIAGIEKEIRAGRIRQVFLLRLGYLLYSDPDMTDYAWAVPRWVLDCDYITEENARLIAREHQYDEDGELTLWAAPEFVQLPIDAQSGEPILFTTGDEETFRVPDIAVWEDE